MNGAFEALLDSWDRNNVILINLLRALTPGALAANAMEGSKSFGEMFVHIHFTRLYFISQCAPEFSTAKPDNRSVDQDNAGQIAHLLNESAKLVRDAVKSRVERGQQMEVLYDHPILMIQHLIWHDAYHHGQMKLALKLAGHPLDDEEIGPVTWDVWMDKH